MLIKRRCCRTRGAGTQRNIESVRLSAAQCLKASCQRRSQELGLSRMNTGRILKVHLKPGSYHLHGIQKLPTRD